MHECEQCGELIHEEPYRFQGYIFCDVDCAKEWWKFYKRQFKLQLVVNNKEKNDGSET